MKEIKLNPKEWTLLLDLKAQLDQARAEAASKESAFLGSIYGLCAAKEINADAYNLTTMQIKDGKLYLVPKEPPVPQAIDTGNGKAS